MNEDLHAGEWIVSRLEGDSGSGGLFDPARLYNGIPFVPSGVYRDLIPPGKKLPAIRFHLQKPYDIRTVGQTRIMARLEWLIVLVTEGLRITPLLPLCDRMDTLLHEASGETSTVRVLECTRLEPFHLVEPDDSGVQYRHAGGIYRTMVQAK
jgi:hypothetical protein